MNTYGSLLVIYYCFNDREEYRDVMIIEVCHLVDIYNNLQYDL